jgi:hypothetical protein
VDDEEEGAEETEDEKELESKESNRERSKMASVRTCLLADEEEERCSGSMRALFQSVP